MNEAIGNILWTVGSNIGTVAVLGYFVKRWINGTAADIRRLRDTKVEKEIWNVEKNNLEEKISDNKCELEKINDKLADIKTHVAMIPYLREFQMELRKTLRENEIILRAKEDNA